MVVIMGGGNGGGGGGGNGSRERLRREPQKILSMEKRGNPLGAPNTKGSTSGGNRGTL